MHTKRTVRTGLMMSRAYLPVLGEERHDGVGQRASQFDSLKLLLLLDRLMALAGENVTLNVTWTNETNETRSLKSNSMQPKMRWRQRLKVPVKSPLSLGTAANATV